MVHVHNTALIAHGGLVVMPSSALRVFVAASVAAALVAGDDAPPEGMAEDLAKVADRWREGSPAPPFSPPPPLPPAPPGGYPPPPPAEVETPTTAAKSAEMDDSALEMRLAEEENAAARAGGGAHRAPVALALAAIGSARLLVAAARGSRPFL